MPLKVGLKYIDIWKDSMEDAVLRYEKEPQYQDQIVFYGPSYFTRWSTRYGMTPLREMILGSSGAPCAVNRGFGSSCPEHQLYYYPRLIRPLTPRVLVYAPTFGNGKAFGYTLDESWELAQRVLAYTMADFPECRIYLCGAHPVRDLSDEDRADQIYWDKLLREFAEANDNCTFADLLAYPPLLRKDIFVADGVHFNEEGYRIYADFFRMVLKDELNKY